MRAHASVWSLCALSLAVLLTLYGLWSLIERSSSPPADAAREVASSNAARALSELAEPARARAPAAAPADADALEARAPGTNAPVHELAYYCVETQPSIYPLIALEGRPVWLELLVDPARTRELVSPCGERALAVRLNAHALELVPWRFIATGRFEPTALAAQRFRLIDGASLDVELCVSSSAAQSALGGHGLMEHGFEPRASDAYTLAGPSQDQRMCISMVRGAVGSGQRTWDVELPVVEHWVSAVSRELGVRFEWRSFVPGGPDFVLEPISVPVFVLRQDARAPLDPSRIDYVGVSESSPSGSSDAVARYELDAGALRIESIGRAADESATQYRITIVFKDGSRRVSEWTTWGGLLGLAHMVELRELKPGADEAR